MHCMNQLPGVTMQSFLTILSRAKVVKVHEPLACFKCSSSYTQCTMSTVEWSRAENVFIQEMGWLEANGKSSGEEGQAREVTDALRVIFQSSELFRCNTISYTYWLNESQRLQQHFLCAKINIWRSIQNNLVFMESQLEYFWICYHINVPNIFLP